MAEEEVRIPIVVTDEAAADAQLRRLLSTVEDLTRAVSAQATALEAQTQAQVRTRKETAQATSDADRHADAIKKLEKAYYAALKPSQKTAVQLAELHRLDLTAIKDAEARAEAERMRASAIAQTTLKMEDQARREKANRGRSLSMLFDEQNAILERLPGRLGEYAQALSVAKSAIAAVSDEYDKIKESGEAGNASILAMVGTLGSVVTIGAAVAGTIAGLNAEFLATVEQVSKLSQATGISVEQLSRYQVAATQYGFQLDDLADAHANVADKLQDAATGGKVTAALFKALGVQVTDTQGRVRDVQTVFLELTDVLSTMTNRTEALAVAQQFLGEEGSKKLLPAIQAQPMAFRAAAAAADDLGLTLSGASLDAARQHKQAADDLTLAWQAFKRDIAEDSAIVRFFDDLKIGLANTLGDGVYIGQKRLSSGILATVKAYRVGSESVGEFADRVRRQRDELEAANREWAKAHAQTVEVTAALNAATEAESARTEAAKRSNEAAREAERLAEARARRLKAEAEAAGGRLGKTLAEGEQMLAVARVELARDTAEELDRISEELMQAEMDRIDRRIAAEVAYAEQVKASRARLVDDSIMLATQLADGTAVILERMGKDQSKAAVAAFRVQQALSVAQITIDAVRAAAGVYADFPGGPGVRAIAAGVAFAAVEAMALKVAAEKPPQVAHMGGVSRAGTSATRPGEVPATLEQGEVVVSASQARAMGGPEQTLAAIRAAASGRGASQTVIVYDGRTISRAVRDDLATGGHLYRATRGAQRVGLVR